MIQNIMKEHNVHLIIKTDCSRRNGPPLLDTKLILLTGLKEVLVLFTGVLLREVSRTLFSSFERSLAMSQLYCPDKQRGCSDYTSIIYFTMYYYNVPYCVCYCVLYRVHDLQAVSLNSVCAQVCNVCK